NLHHFIDEGVEVTVVQPSEYHYYSGMGPGMLGSTYSPDDIRFATRQQVERKGGRFILDKAAVIDPENQRVTLEGSDTPLYYDVLSCNVGSYVPRELVDGQGEHIFTAKPIEQLLPARQQILTLASERSVNVAVVGSGPSAIEIAGNIRQLCRKQTVYPVAIQMFGGKNFMSGRPARVRSLTKKMLLRKGIEIIEGDYVSRISGNTITLDSGKEYCADIIFPSLGVKPSPIFVKSGLPTGSDGGLLVNEYLQSTKYPNIFGGGDCVCFKPQPLDKVGVYAVRQNPVLYGNLKASLAGAALEKFSPGGDYLLIYNLGDGEGVLSKWALTFSGKLAFVIKDFIDRRFIRAFQET
ncbi:MAG: NAD(P)/FAD-dependent oxidoreductase, partial [Desulforhopalus sp.]